MKRILAGNLDYAEVRDIQVKLVIVLPSTVLSLVVISFYASGGVATSVGGVCLDVEQDSDQFGTLLVRRGRSSIVIKDVGRFLMTMSVERSKQEGHCGQECKKAYGPRAGRLGIECLVSNNRVIISRLALTGDLGVLMGEIAADSMHHIREMEMNQQAIVLQVAAGFVLFFNAWGMINTLAVFQTYSESGELFKASSCRSLG
ncbi:hypothetical protein KXW26_009625 [Aspergillus fumigatus]|nr:hypothetical protein KXW26_009625 [Aspergillus fumigatus]KAH2319656.1 hypothetical protein KXW82_000269 [Aspergillus fumigatus]